MIAEKNKKFYWFVFVWFALVFFVLSPTTTLADTEQPPTDAEVKAEALRVTDEERKKIPQQDLQVKIPGLNFSNAIIQGKGESVNGCDLGYICIDTLARYINRIYIFVAGASVTFAIVLIMVGGAQYAVGSAAGTVDAGKKRMWNAVIGLVIILSAHSILVFVNPDIASVQPLRLQVVEEVKPYSGSTSFGGGPGNPALVEGEAIKVTTNSFVLSSGTNIHPDVLTDLALATKGVKTVTEQRVRIFGARGPEWQAREYFNKCLVAGDGQCIPRSVCNPFARDGSGSLELVDNKWRLKQSVLNEFEKDGDLTTDEGLLKHLVEEAQSNQHQKCPFESGYVVSAWCENAKHLELKTPAECHITLEQAFKSAGWCRSPLEPNVFVHKSHIEVLQNAECNWTIGEMSVVDPDGTFRNFEYGSCRKDVDFLQGKCD